jgi:hypothetical protein
VTINITLRISVIRQLADSGPNLFLFVDPPAGGFTLSTPLCICVICGQIFYSKPAGGFVEPKNIPAFTLKRQAFVHKTPAFNENLPAMLNNRQR